MAKHGFRTPRISIPVKLNETLDPRNVLRFALYYRAGSPLAPAWEVVSADVEMPRASDRRERLLDATLSGVIAKQGELASVERDQVGHDLQQRCGLR